jgi:aminomethyltransferase
MTEGLHQTPLHDLHIEQGARMVAFAGWHMPLEFRGITEEHNHTRTACSVFDVSHMGRLKVTGDDAGALLDRVCTRNLARAEVGRCYYSHICREDGGVLDDVLVYRYDEHWGVVCNASNREKIVAWLNRQAQGKQAAVQDETFDTAMVACQGPRTLELGEALSGHNLATLRRYGFEARQIGPMQIVTSRTGYTGEDGVEVILPSMLVPFLAPKLFGTLDEPHPVIRPAGLGARDTLRIEAAMPLYGHELSEDWDSLTAGQSWCVDLSKDFIGADRMRSVKEQGLPRKLVGLELDGRRIARQGYKVLAAGADAGIVTSGTLSPTLEKSIAMAIIGTAYAEPGTTLEVELRGNKRAGATVVSLPFYKRRTA